MNSQDFRNLQEAYLDVYEQEITLKGTGPRLVDPYADSGESKSGGKMKGPKMKNVIKKEEFESWVNNLVEEGYDLSDYTWDELYENYTQLDEISQQTATRAFAQRATNEFETDQTSKKSDATKSRIEKKFGKKAGAHAERAAHANIFGRKSSSMPKESYDLYDIILSHLIDEGYADTEEAAERIMVNMSEDWRESIVVEGYKEIDSAKHQRMYARYKNLRTAAMKDARETGEASGDNRFKMSKMSGVIDKSAENLRNKR